MLLNDFFKILETKTNEASFVVKIQLNKEHPIYQGHFPGNPVVPGVCLIQMIKELVEGNVGKELRLLKADNVKFLNMVNPQENEFLFFDIAVKSAETLAIKATLLFEEKTFLKFQGSFQ